LDSVNRAGLVVVLAGISSLRSDLPAAAVEEENEQEEEEEEDEEEERKGEEMSLPPSISMPPSSRSRLDASLMFDGSLACESVGEMEYAPFLPFGLKGHHESRQRSAKSI
jgi:hypothetical protein